MKQLLSILLITLAIGLVAVTPDSLATKPLENSAPVIFRERVLFYIHSNYGDIKPFERSVIISHRLEDLSKLKKVSPDSLLISQKDQELVISYGDRAIMTITAVDSLLLGMSIAQIGDSYFKVLSGDFLPLISKFSLRSTIISIAKILIFFALIIFVTWYSIKLVKKLMDRLMRIVGHIRYNYREGFHLKGIQVISAKQIDQVLTLLLRLIKVAIYVVILYFAFYLMLYVIPGTRGFARQLQGYITSPVRSVGAALVDYIPNIFFIAVILIFAKYLLKALRFIFDEIEKGHLNLPNFYPEWSIPTYQMVRILVYFFVIIVIFPYLPGSESPAFKGISVFVGVIFSLGSSSAISNMVAGIILTYMRPYKVGDIIKIGEIKGELIETSLLVIRIKTFKNEEITIPNSIVLSGNIVDYTRYANENQLIVHTRITIGYDVPWKQVHELLIEASRRTEGIHHEHAPFVLQTALSDYYVEYELNVFTGFPSVMPRIKSELHKHIQDTFKEAGVEIMSPMYNAVRDGNESTIPGS